MMKTYKTTIQGISPLLLNRFTEAEQMKIEGGSSSAMTTGGRGTPREQAEPKLYRDSKGRLVLPGPNLFSCLIEAGKYHKAGKRQITTGKSSMIPAGIAVLEIEMPLIDPHSKSEAKWEVDSRPIVNPATKGRRLTHRPRLDEWSIAFTLDIDTSFFDPKLVRAILDDAGKRIGLGDFRPDRKGPFGRFVVTNWEAQ